MNAIPVAHPSSTGVSPDALEAVIAATIAPNAATVDQSGAFPQAGIDALAEAGYLGLISSSEVGGAGAGMGEAAAVIETVARECGSTAMVLLMHYAATAVIEATGLQDARTAVAEGRHLSTLAFSEVGSRSHFWAPMSTATSNNGTVRLDARKSWVTSAGHADSYVWSSRPLGPDGAMTLWLVPSDTAGLRVAGPFDGLGLRGNASRPVTGEGVTVGRAAMLGADGTGMDIAMSTALPWFLVLNAAFSLGLIGALTDEAHSHLRSTRLEHLDRTLAEQPISRHAYARLRIQADQVHTFLDDTIAAMENQRADGLLRVLEVKAVAGEAAAVIADSAMRLCGGSAFRKELGIERRFRDALAARVMAPTTDVLYDFVARASFDMPLLDAGEPR